MIPGTKTTGERSHRHLKTGTEDVDDESEKLRAELAAVEEVVEAQQWPLKPSKNMGLC